MNRQTFIVLGILLAIFGALALGWQTISYTTRETVVDVGPVKVTADKTKDLPISPILGGIALAGGAAMIVVGIQKSRGGLAHSAA